MCYHGNVRWWWWSIAAKQLPTELRSDPQFLHAIVMYTKAITSTHWDHPRSKTTADTNMFNSIVFHCFLYKSVQFFFIFSSKHKVEVDIRWVCNDSVSRARERAGVRACVLMPVGGLVFDSHGIPGTVAYYSLSMNMVCSHSNREFY